MRELILSTLLVFFCFNLFGQRTQIQNQDSKTEWYNLEQPMETISGKSVNYKKSPGLGNNPSIFQNSPEQNICGDKWEQYSSGNHVLAILEVGNFIWIGTTGGLAKLSKTDGTKELYNNANSGLSNNHVRSLMEDHQGNIWAATLNGVSKFDGTNWENFHPGNSGLASKLGRVLLEGANHHIWMGTQGGGLCRFDGTNWQTFNTQNSDLPHDDILDLTEDSSGNIWVATNGGGVAKYDGIIWEVFNSGNSLLPANKVISFLKSYSGSIVIATPGLGVAQYDNEKWLVFTVADDDFPSDHMNSMLMAANDFIWIASQDNGVSRFNGYFWDTFNTSSSDIPSNSCTAIIEDTEGNIWVGTTDRGIIKFDHQTWEQIDPIDMVTNDLFFALLKDRNGIMWAASLGGLIKIENGIAQVMNTSNSRIPTNDIRGLIEDSNGIKWMTSYEGMVISYDEENNIWTSYDETNSNLPSQPMGELVEDNDGNIWVATYGGLAKFNGLFWDLYHTKNSDIPHNLINGLLSDTLGNLWLATNNGGLAWLSNGIWQESFTTSNSGLPHNHVFHLMQDKNGHLWMATAAGIAKYDGTDWTVFDTSNTNLPTNATTTLYEDSSGKIWVGVFGEGISVYDHGNWSHYSTIGSGIPSNIITHFLEGNNGEIWIAGVGGLAALKPALNPYFQSQVSCMGNSSFFENQSYFPNSSRWLVDGMEVSNEKDLQFHFGQSRDYEIILEVTDAQGCMATYKEWISIPAVVWALDEYLPDTISICDGNTLNIDPQLYTFADYQWFFEGNLIHTSPILYDVGTEGTYYLTVVDSCGMTTTNGVYVLAGANAENCVWPGDTNYDGITNHKDLLPIGLAYNTVGNIRPHATLEWEEQAALNWDAGYGGVNHKHIDCDGNSHINGSDISAIISNYGKSHASLLPKQPPLPEDAPYTLIPVFEGFDVNTNQILFSIDLFSNQDSPPPFYGLAFSLEYESPLPLDTASATPLSPQAAILGNVLSISQQYPTRTEIAMVGMDQKNRSLDDYSENGNFIQQSIIKYSIGIELEFPGVDGPLPLSVRPTEIIMLDNNGNFIPVKGTEAVSFLLDIPNSDMAARTTGSNKYDDVAPGKDIKIENPTKLFPNPVTEKQLVLEYYSNEQGVLDIQFLDIYGRRILSLKENVNRGKNQFVIHIPTLNNGIYLIQLSKNKNTETIRLIVDN